MLVAGRTGSGKSTLLGTVNGLVPHFTGGHLDGRRAASPARRIRGRAPRELAHLVGVRRPGPAGRRSSPTSSRTSSPTAWSSSAWTRRRCAAGSRRRSTCSASPSCAPARCATLSGGQQQRVAIGSVLTMHPRRAGARRADLRARPDRRRGRARHARPAGPRPRRSPCWSPSTGWSGWCRSPTGCSCVEDGAVRGGPPAELLRRLRRSPRRWSSSAGSPAGSRCRCRCARRAGARPCCATAPGRARRRRTAARRRRPRAGRARASVVRYGRTVAVRDVDLDARGRRGDRADGPQRVGQVVAAVGAAGLRPRAAPGTVSVRRASTRPPCRRRGRARWSGWCRRPPSDLLYLETVDAECARRRRRRPARRRAACRRAARPARARASTAPRTRATCPRASGSRWCWRSCSPRGPRVLAARRADPRPGLRRQAARSPRSSRDLAARRAAACCVATHDVEFVAQVADRVVVLAGGEVVSDGADRRGARRVAGLRPAGRQGARPRLAHRRPGRARRWP